jgi:hypothetical protein
MRKKTIAGGMRRRVDLFMAGLFSNPILENPVFV